MTKKDYELIAAAIRHTLEDAAGALTASVVHRTAENIADALARENSRFDRARFLHAAGVR